MKNENLLAKAAVCQHLDYYKESFSLHLKQRFLYKCLSEQEFFSLDRWDMLKTQKLIKNVENSQLKTPGRAVKCKGGDTSLAVGTACCGRGAAEEHPLGFDFSLHILGLQGNCTHGVLHSPGSTTGCTLTSH